MQDSDITQEQIDKFYTDLTKLVPDFIANFPTNKQIFKAQGEEIAKLKFYIQDLIDNTFIETATWGLDILEFEYGITPKSTDTLEIRRNRLLAKKRGLNPSTPYNIRQICNSFVDNTKLVQHFEDYYFELFLENVNKGFTNFLEDLIEIIEDLKPAHLGVRYRLVETTKSNLYIGAYSVCGEVITTYPWTANDLETYGNIEIGVTNYVNSEIVTIYPKN